MPSLKHPRSKTANQRTCRTRERQWFVDRERRERSRRIIGPSQKKSKKKKSKRRCCVTINWAFLVAAVLNLKLNPIDKSLLCARNLSRFPLNMIFIWHSWIVLLLLIFWFSVSMLAKLEHVTFECYTPPYTYVHTVCIQYCQNINAISREMIAIYTRYNYRFRYCAFLICAIRNYHDDYIGTCDYEISCVSTRDLYILHIYTVMTENIDKAINYIIVIVSNLYVKIK